MTTQKDAPIVTWIRGILTDGLTPLLMLMFLPVLSIAAHYVFGVIALYALAMAVPVAVSVAVVVTQHTRRFANLRDKAAPLRRAALEAALDDHLGQKRFSGRNSACIVLCIDDYQGLCERLGRRSYDSILMQIESRINETLRDADLLARTDEAEFALALSPSALLDLETLLQISARLQSCVSEPVVVDAMTLRVSASIGFCQSDRLDHPSGTALVQAAEAAADEARRHGAGSIRAYSTELHRQLEGDRIMRGKIEAALVSGQIGPWFQPQISTDTGKVSGFEALARWIDPDLGLVPPADFLPIIDKAGLMERLGEIILAQSLAALRTWDKAGFDIPRVGVNFSAIELRNPHFVERIAWELDRFDLTPDRLAIEILESVISDAPEDIISRNISGLAELGCQIDLDDFGTGHASITSIRRFAVARLKIDRSFISQVDADPEQQRMVGAILTMAERLGLTCLAEGVETPGEHAMLSQLGCGDVQGFLLGRAMPVEDTADWLTRHAASIVPPPTLRRRIG